MTSSSFKGKSTAHYFECFKEIKKFDIMALLTSEVTPLAKKVHFQIDLEFVLFYVTLRAKIRQ